MSEKYKGDFEHMADFLGQLDKEVAIVFRGFGNTAVHIVQAIRAKKIPGLRCVGKEEVLVPLSLLKEVESKGTWGTTHIACCPICKGFKNSQIVGRPVKHDPTCALGKAIKGG